MSEEGRFHPRMRSSVVADVIGHEVMLAQPLDDISLGGCRFLGTAWEPVGRELDIVLDFPASGATVQLVGMVVRATEHDMGVRFHQITDDQKWALRKHLRESQAH